MNYIFFLLIVVFGFISCQTSPERVTQAENSITSFSKELRQSKDLILCGSGGAMLEDIKIFAMAFQSQQLLSLEEGRKLYVEIAEKFLRKINNDEKIRPFLNSYPITIKNLDISISFYQGSQRAPSKYIAFITTSNINPDYLNDFIYYAIYDHEVEQLGTIHKESYEEALKIVSEQKYK